MYEYPTAETIRADVVRRIASLLSEGGISPEIAHSVAILLVENRFDFGDLLSEYTHAEFSAE